MMKSKKKYKRKNKEDGRDKAGTEMCQYFFENRSRFVEK